MKRWMTRIAGAALLAMATIPAFAQDSTNIVGTATDWSIFAETNPTECWGVSSPRESTAVRDGESVKPTRSAILLFVTFRPGSGAGEVSYTGGYPFAEGSTVSVAVDGATFEMITDGEYAWTSGPEADAALLNAMKRGTTAVLVARSTRGTQTTDTFSLRGFTAAMEEAAKRCTS